MEYISKLEHTIGGWLKNAPHLPVDARKWIATNSWWIVTVLTVLDAIAIVILITSVLGNMAVIGSTVASYYVSTTFLTVTLIRSIVSLVFCVIEFILLIMAIRPLREKQKKGWVLMFGVLLLGAVSAVVSALITLSVFNFIQSIIFSALWLAISAYFLFEIRSEFAHVERSAGAKKS